MELIYFELTWSRYILSKHGVDIFLVDMDSTASRSRLMLISDGNVKMYLDGL